MDTRQLSSKNVIATFLEVKTGLEKNAYKFSQQF